MSAAPLSLDENQRLAALRALAILDTPAEPAFDALCRLAGQALDAPIAFIGLLDAQRLWFKAQLGLTLPELDRQLTFGPDLPIAAPPIADLTQDARFSAHPLVSAGPRLRAYAGAPLVDAHGVVLGTLAVLDTTPRDFSAAQLHSLRDLADLVMCALRERQQAQQLAHLAMTDPLTGLANRAHFERTLQAEFGRAVRLGEPFTLLLLNLDGFKAVNDGFGHGAGDETLQEVSQRLRTQMRAGDVLARLGADEFGIVMRDGDTACAQALARRIVRAVSQPIQLSSGDEVGVGVSLGMAAYGDAVASVRKLVAQADQALYEAKKQNERRWKMFVGMRA